jgi:hypothetical protein
MKNFYIDTCSLKWRYLNGNRTSDVNAIVETGGNNVFTSELTILEWSSAFGVAVRSGEIDKSLFKANEMALFTDIAQSSLKIFKITRLIERARFWVEFVGVVNQRALRAYDAIHLTAALELSSTLAQPVEFVTSDTKLAAIVSDFDAFKPHLNSQFLDPAC